MMENETLENKTFKSTYKTAIGFLVVFSTIITSVNVYLNNNSSKFDSVNQKIEKLETSVNSKFDVVTITQKNQYQSSKNDRKRDSTDAANRFKAQDDKLNIVTNLLYRMSPYNQKPISSN